MAWWMMTLIRRKQPESEQQKLLELLQEMQEKDNNNSGSTLKHFRLGKDAISGAKDSVANVVENVTVSTEELVQKVENSLNHFIEAVAVMIITSCVIPMLVLLLFFWMVKIVLDVDLSGVKRSKGMLPERRNRSNLAERHSPFSNRFFVPYPVDTDEYRKNYMA